MELAETVGVVGFLGDWCSVSQIEQGGTCYPLRLQIQCRECRGDCNEHGNNDQPREPP